MMTSQIPEMIRAGAIVSNLRATVAEAKENERSLLRSIAFAGDGDGEARYAINFLSDTADVIQELMNEIQRRDIREDHARRKADELVGWLNGRWG